MNYLSRSKFRIAILLVTCLFIIVSANNVGLSAGVALASRSQVDHPASSQPFIVTPQQASQSSHQTLAGKTKNDTVQPASDPAGVTRSFNTGPDGKTAVRSPSAVINPPAATFTNGGQFMSCGTIRDGGWTTTSAAFETIVSCTMELPEAGFVYMSGTTSIGVGTGGNYEARLNLNIDSTAGNSNSDRWINAYTDATDGTDKNIANTLLAPVSAGSHTFYFLGARYNGSGTVQLYDASLSVLYFPSSSLNTLGCGASGNTVWNTSETSFQEIRSCSLNIPQAGFVFVSGTASAGLASGGSPYEARYRLGVDAVTGTANTDRWVNITTDSGDGTDEAVVDSFITPVVTGTHTFYFSAARYNGTGPVQLYDPSLSVLYFPAPSVVAKVCGASGSDTWTNSTTSYSVIRSCTLDVPRNSFAFIDASASAGLNDTGAGNDWEGQFRLGIDNDTGSSIFDRWVNVYTDDTDGTDRPVSDGGIVNISQGAHTFYFVGRRYAGNGTLRLYSPSISVLVPGAVNFVPLIQR